MSTRATAISSAGRLSAARTATRRADCSSVSRRATTVDLWVERVSERIVLLGAFKVLPGFHKARAPADRGSVRSNPSTAQYIFIRMVMPNHSPGFSTASVADKEPFLPAKCHMKWEPWEGEAWAT